MLAGLVADGLVCVPVRVAGNGQPDASAGLPYHLLYVASSRVPWVLVPYRNSRQADALLYIERQSLRSFRLLGRRHGHSLEDLAVSRFDACPVLINHEFHPFREATGLPVDDRFNRGNGHHRTPYRGATTARLRLKATRDTAMIMDWVYAATLFPRRYRNHIIPGSAAPPKACCT